jgi:hypothetical protein
VINLPSGIRVPAGETLTIWADDNNYESCHDNKIYVEYTLSGYHAQP